MFLIATFCHVCSLGFLWNLRIRANEFLPYSAFLINESHADDKQKEEEFIFSDISERPVPSLLRGYSAPIRLDSDLTDSDLFFLLANDSDEFNRYVFFYIFIFNFYLRK